MAPGLLPSSNQQENAPWRKELTVEFTVTLDEHSLKIWDLLGKH
jgi:hypothetical protein